MPDNSSEAITPVYRVPPLGVTDLVVIPSPHNFNEGRTFAQATATNSAGNTASRNFVVNLDLCAG